MFTDKRTSMSYHYIHRALRYESKILLGVSSEIPRILIGIHKRNITFNSTVGRLIKCVKYYYNNNNCFINQF